MKDNISIIGAGLVGSLLGLYLKQKGHRVTIFEKRKDPRATQKTEGRSINLALSRRGILPLKETGIFDKIQPFLIPMKGRMMHDEKGKLTFQPYGKEGEHINSVSRAMLNEALIHEAEEMGVTIHFDHKGEDISVESTSVQFENGKQINSDLLVGTDGAFSVVRKKMQITDRFNYQQYYIEHGYKELTIDAQNNDFALDPNYLHIWPRGNFMLIALPNMDKTFTCTLFFPFEGDPSFSGLQTDAEVLSFFERYFEDTLPLLPDLVDQFNTNPTSSLVTIRCDPWNKNRTILLGDASHAIVPFYGQGMNSGFEDVRLFIKQAESMNWNWDAILPSYATERKKDADAISELALHNFIEMRDHVADPEFLRRKKLEAKIQKAFPEDWIPLYSMVTFSDLPYSEALRLGKLQKEILDTHLAQDIDQLDINKIVNQFNTLKQAD